MKTSADESVRVFALVLGLAIFLILKAFVLVKTRGDIVNWAPEVAICVCLVIIWVRNRNGPDGHGHEQLFVLEPAADSEPDEEDLAAIGRGLADMDAGRTVPGEAAFARLREKYGFVKGDAPLFLDFRRHWRDA